MKTTRLAAWLLLALASVCPAGIEITKPRETEVGFVQLRALSFEEARVIVAPFLSPNGRLGFAPARSLLIVHDYPEQIKAIKTILEKVDTVPVNIRVAVHFGETRRDASADAGISMGGVSVSQRGGRMRVTGSGSVHAGAGDAQQSQDTTQFVVTLNGRPARIWVGETVFDPVWVYDYGYRRGWWRQEFQAQDLGASLWVLPRLLPNGLIEVQVFPRLTSRGDQPLSIDVKELATTVVAGDGQSMQLGGLDEARAEAYTRLFGIGRFVSERNLLITVTPTLQVAATPSAAPRRE